MDFRGAFPRGKDTGAWTLTPILFWYQEWVELSRPFLMSKCAFMTCTVKTLLYSFRYRLRNCFANTNQKPFCFVNWWLLLSKNTFRTFNLWAGDFEIPSGCLRNVNENPLCRQTVHHGDLRGVFCPRKFTTFILAKAWFWIHRVRGHLYQTLCTGPKWFIRYV
jgi:hypothetical protein